MKIEDLLNKLEVLRLQAESDYFDENYGENLVVYWVMDALVEYIANSKVEEKIKEIPMI